MSFIFFSIPPKFFSNYLNLIEKIVAHFHKLKMTFREFLIAKKIELLSKNTLQVMILDNFNMYNQFKFSALNFSNLQSKNSLILS